MELYNVKGNSLEQVKRSPFKLEKEIQSLVESNVEDLFDVEFVSSEYSIGEFRIDTLCYDNENNCFVIIEYKKGNSYSVVDQGFAYLSIMLNNKADFVLEFNESKKRQLKREDVDWSQSRVIFISQSFNNYQKNSVNFRNIPFELWEIKRFSNNTISLSQHNSDSKESINTISGGKNKIIEDVSREVKVFSEEDTFNNKKVDSQIRELYFQLKEKISVWEDFSINAKANYISLKRNKKVFAFLNFRKSYMRVHILGYIKTRWDGSRKRVSPSNKFILDDSKKMFKTWENEYKFIYSYDLKNDRDLDYFVLMLKQKYDSLA